MLKNNQAKIDESITEVNKRSSLKSTPTNFAHMRVLEHHEIGEFVCLFIFSFHFV